MNLSLTSTASSIGQLITVILIVVFVLALTYWVTKWIGNYQKEKAPGENIEIIECKRVSQNKLVEIVRIGNRYFALGLGKDEVTMISELDEESLSFQKNENSTFSFKDFLNKARDDGETNNK